MGTVVALGAAYLGGKIVEGIGASNAAEKQAEAAQAQLDAAQAQQDIENQRAEALMEPSLQAQQTQLALLGQGGPEEAQAAAASLMDSPLVAAINQQNQQNVNAQAAASGVSGGNLLTALQDANTSTIMQAGFGGLGQVAGQQQNAALGFSGLGMQALGLANQAQGNLGNANAASAAIPWMVGADILNQGAQAGMMAYSGGAGAVPTGSGVGAANGMGGTINSPMSFGSAAPLAF